ncbi:MAG: hypothetical protein IJZ74_09525 [Clostridia bacterium]|nr:hypothetical protein [Clostridia bacterium]
MEMLKTFAALSMAAGTVLSLLPDGSIRKTAGMVVGLLMLLCWAEGIAELLQLPDAPSLPQTVLSPSAAAIEEASAAALNSLLSRMEVSP